ncbi:MAG TPA: hypothetical protein VI248_25040 [Kineosporiaceae bacterium]
MTARDDATTAHRGTRTDPAAERSPTGARGSGLDRPHRPIKGQRAAHHATERNSLRITAPLIGTVKVPPTDELAFLGGMAALAALGVLEWPVAGALAAGHLLSASTRSKVLQDFGKALEEA